MPRMFSSTVEATIANGAAVSSAILLRDEQPLRVLIPASWTAADLAVQLARVTEANELATPASGDWKYLRDAYGSLVGLLGITADCMHGFGPLDPLLFHGAHWMRLVSRTASTLASDVNQGGARTLVITKRLIG